MQAAPDDSTNRAQPGTAFVVYWAPGVIDEDVPVAHYAIIVYTNTELSGNTPSLGTSSELAGIPNTVIQPIGPHLRSATSIHPIPIPDALGAREFQQSSYGPNGTYNLSTNSCITHVGDVLRNGGVQGVGNDFSSNLKFFSTVNIPTKVFASRKKPK
jgi:hypothetical protein